MLPIKAIELPCSHVICPECIPKQAFGHNVFRYQCSTCFVYHEIPLNDDNTIMDRENEEKFRRYEMESSSHSNADSSIVHGDCVYCFSCEEAVSLKEYIRGRHHKHEVTTFEEALPKIKNIFQEQLRLVKQIKSHFQEVKEGIENNELEISYNQLVDRVNIYFNKQIEFLEAKHNEIIEELKDYHERLSDEAKENIDKLSPIIYDLEEIQAKMQDFVKDKLPITEINPIRNFIEKIQTFKELTKDKNFLTVQEMPHFITNYSMEKYIDESCKIEPTEIILKSRKNVFEPVEKTNKIVKSFKNLQQFPQFVSLSKKEPEEKEIKFERKVKLVEKLKDKMKYTASMCSTDFL